MNHYGSILFSNIIAYSIDEKGRLLLSRANIHTDNYTHENFRARLAIVDLSAKELENGLGILRRVLFAYHDISLQKNKYNPKIHMVCVRDFTPLKLETGQYRPIRLSLLEGLVGESL